MNFDIAKEYKKQLEKAEKEASDTLNAIDGISSGPMGLTPDSIKSNPEYQKAKQAYELAFNTLRNFNGWYCKQFKKEIREERRNKYAKS